MRNFVCIVRDALAQFVASRQHQPAILNVQVFLFGGFVKSILCLRAAFTRAFIAPRYLMVRGLDDWIVRVRHDRPTDNRLKSCGFCLVVLRQKASSSWNRLDNFVMPQIPQTRQISWGRLIERRPREDEVREHYSSPCFGCNLMTLPFLEVEGPSIQAM
jgi:hypothetical protein